MSKVLKYTLPTSYGWHDIKMPKDGESIGVQVQRNKPVLYLIGSLEEIITVRVYCAWTGMDVPDDISAVLGSALLDDDSFATHYFI